MRVQIGLSEARHSVRHRFIEEMMSLLKNPWSTGLSPYFSFKSDFLEIGGTKRKSIMEVFARSFDIDPTKGTSPHSVYATTIYMWCVMFPGVIGFYINTDEELILAYAPKKLQALVPHVNLDYIESKIIKMHPYRAVSFSTAEKKTFTTWRFIKSPSRITILPMTRSPRSSRLKLRQDRLRVLEDFDSIPVMDRPLTKLELESDNLIFNAILSHFY